MPARPTYLTVAVLTLGLFVSAPASAAWPRISAQTPPRPTDAQLLETVAHKAFAFFWNESHSKTGLTRDRARNRLGMKDTHTIASIAATGYALAALPVGVERGWVSRHAAYERARTTLRFLNHRFPHVRGFHYHFVDWDTGARAWKSELSSIDTCLLVLGALAAGQYWHGTEVERLANALYARVDFPWMQAGGRKDPEDRSLSMGWRPETGFIEARWQGYTEASYLYLLALGAPRHALGQDTWDRWRIEVGTVEGYPVFGGAHPLFWAQMTPGYYDLRGLRDRQGRDWWTNFRNDHLANHAYCARNPEGRKTYSRDIWGITACDQPPPVGYGAQNPRDGENDGTVAPTAAIASIVFTPDLARRSARALFDQHRDRIWGRYGFANAFNVDKGWYDPDVIGIDLGMMLLALENHRSGLLWRLMRRHPSTKRALATAGFRRAQSSSATSAASAVASRARARTRSAMPTAIVR